MKFNKTLLLQPLPFVFLHLMMINYFSYILDDKLRSALHEIARGDLIACLENIALHVVDKALNPNASQNQHDDSSGIYVQRVAVITCRHKCTTAQCILHIRATTINKLCLVAVYRRMKVIRFLQS